MINKLQFSVEIKAEKTKIWEALWTDSNYRDWTSVFSEGSYAVTDNWKEGSRVMFLGPDKGGIYSTIETHIPNEKMSFKHIGLVVNGEEQPLDDETKAWSGTKEIYTLTEGEGCNILTVDIDVLDEHLDSMKSTFSKAFEKVKHNCYKSS